MGLKSTWWIADESEAECPDCANVGCDACDPDYEDFYKDIDEVLPNRRHGDIRQRGQRLRILRPTGESDVVPKKI